jgi:hypothetical protein
MRNRYLCIKITEAAVFGDLQDGGDPSAWCDVSWAGVQKRTRVFKKPHVNQTLYFKIPIPPSIRSSPIKLEKYLQEELQTKSEIQVTVWADTHKATIESMGSGKICISNIGNSGNKYEDLEFQDPITKSVTKY